MGEVAFFGYQTEQERDQAVKKLEAFLKEEELKEFEDNIKFIQKLINLTPEMKKVILEDIQLKRIAISFKFCTSHFIKTFLEGLNSPLKQEFLYGLQGKYTIGEVLKTTEEFVHYLKRKEEKNELILKTDKDQLI